jgi:hypothetical protein
MLRRSLLLALSLVLVFSLSSFAGEGSDTVGGGKLLPQLRYGYTATEWTSTSTWMMPERDGDFKTHDFYLQCNWGIFENVDLVALVGGQALRYETEGGTQDGHTDWEPMLMWGIGVKATFFRADNGFYVGGGALFTHSFGDRFRFDNYIGGVYSDSWDITMSVLKLTPEVHAGWHIGDTGLTPYLGADYIWSRALTDWYNGGLNEIPMHIEQPFYMFAGIDYALKNGLCLNLEGRTNFDGGWGIGTGVGYMFDICKKPAPAPEPAPAPVIEPKLEPMSYK